MNTFLSDRHRPAGKWDGFRRLGLVAGLAALTSVSALAQSTVTTLADSNNGKTRGFVDGNTFGVARFNFPAGLALDPSGTRLFVADFTNNAIRMVTALGDTANSVTKTVYASGQGINRPISVAVDSSTNIYVLNQGSGTIIEFNGSLLDYNLSVPVATNAVGLVNATSLALDHHRNIYVVVGGNTVNLIDTSGNRSVAGVIGAAGTSLRSVAVMNDGRLALTDAGNHGVWIMDPSNPDVNNNAARLTGFHGAGDILGPTNFAAFNRPEGIAVAGGRTLVVADFNNGKVKVIDANGTVTRLFGIAPSRWSGSTPGWRDGTVNPMETQDTVQARQPYAVAVDTSGNVYDTETFYTLLRQATGTGLPAAPPPPAPVPAPQIGYVDFPPPAFTSVFHAGITNFASFVFNNDMPIVIIGAPGSQTFYNFGATPATGSLPDPTHASPSAPVGYMDGMSENAVASQTVASVMPDLTIKAFGARNDGSPDSSIIQARFQFIVGNPLILGNNAAAFAISDITAGAHLYYTLDGTDPSPTNYLVDLGTAPAGTNTWPVSFVISQDTLFKVRAYRDNYQPSVVVSNLFKTSDFQPPALTFGFASGEASSDFVAAPGQVFYAPVTLTMVKPVPMYSLQFNLTVTNNNGPAIDPGAYGFVPMLQKPLKGDPKGILTPIPTYMFISDAVNPPDTNQIVYYNDTNFINLEVKDLSLNLLTVGWLERIGKTNLYDTTAQDLIKYSMAHDTLFLEDKGKVIVGGYGFRVPYGAQAGQTYRIAIGRASATSDGQGANGNSVYISTPTSGSLTNGVINAVKNVAIGQRKYLVGDVYPFRWFNAGDFGAGDLVTNGSANAEQVFQSAVYKLNQPPYDSDFFDAMDSAGRLGVYNPATGYYVASGTFMDPTNLNALLAGDYTTMNQMAFGDGKLDVCDVFVTFLRSEMPGLTWYTRYWTNGVRVADRSIVNPASAYALAKLPAGTFATAKAKATGNGSEVSPQVNFAAGDLVVAPGQTVQVPVTATILGDYPLRVLMLNLSVTPLDGSPALTSAVKFTPNPALGAPIFTDSHGLGNYAAAWLPTGNTTGLSGTVSLGPLSVTIPPGATASSAYAVSFDHASASPNGVASFPKQTLTGLVTLASRTNSSYGDGIPDAWRLRWFGTLNNQLSQSNACPSGDGVNNWMKYVAGVDPNVAGNFPSVSTKTPVPSGFKSAITWPSVNGKQYVVESSPALFDGKWTAISTNTGTGGNLQFNDSTGGDVKFYRVRILP